MLRSRLRRPLLTAAVASLAALSVAPASPASAAAAAGTAGSGLRLNDPMADLQWHLRRDGLRKAWRVTTGGRVIVAVIDTGADLTHPDLKKNLWTNPGEIAGNGIDDDHNGYVDDVHGYDMVDGDGDPSDRNGHGTHVAGVLAARGNNGIGVSGVAQRARVMIVRALDAQNQGTVQTAARALEYAVANGARVVNMSINGPHTTPELDAAIERARQAGVLIVVSAGNEGQDLGVTPSYPACSTAPNVITVAAVGRNGRLADFSNRGSCVDVSAPGVDIASTAMSGGYELRSGTSMAAPQVAGVLALAVAADPAADATTLEQALVTPVRRARVATAANVAPVAPRASASRLLKRLHVVR